VCPCPRSLGWFVRTAGIPRKRRQHSGEQPLLQGSFVDIRHFFFPFCRFLVVYIIPTRTGELNSNHPQSPVRVESIHMMGFCLMPRRNRLRHCYHRLSAVQPSFTSWLLWTRALFAILACYPTPRRGRRGLDFGGDCAVSTTMLTNIKLSNFHKHIQPNNLNHHPQGISPSANYW
jgi:hypothetical protein